MRAATERRIAHRRPEVSPRFSPKKDKEVDSDPGSKAEEREAGPRRFDGVWAKHWYDAVHKSTGFAGAEGPLPDCEDQVDLLEQALPIYEKLEKLKV